MKILLIFSFGFITFSCQSEYERQPSQCKTIVNKVITIRSTDVKSTNSLKKVAEKMTLVHTYLEMSDYLNLS